MMRFKYVLLTALLFLSVVMMVTAQETEKGGFKREGAKLKGTCEYKGETIEHRMQVWHDEMKTEREDWGKCKVCWDGTFITAFVQHKDYCKGKY